MRDLDLWRRLGSGDVTADELAVVASWPLSRRGAYVGGVSALVCHDDAAVRAGALRVLAGARGVAGVRAIVQALQDADDGVRAAALDALRVTARDAHVRFAHALFHSRLDVRRAALSGELPIATRAIAARLRADPDCADLAAKIPWPDHAFAFVVDLYGGGHLPANELVAVMLRSPESELRGVLETEVRRPAELVDAYLEREPAGPPLGVDILDVLIGALASAGDPRAVDMLVSAVSPKKSKPLARRAAASLLGYIATAELPLPMLVGACAALEPRVIHRLRARDAAAAARGLLRYQWPVRPTVPQVERLLDAAVAQADLELAAAIAGLLPGKRLPELVKRFGLERTLDALVSGASVPDDGDRAWRAICKLPREKPPLDLVLLQQLEARSPARYVALASIAIGIHTGDRLEDFLKAIPRKYREEAFGHALLVQEDADEQRITAVAAVIVARLDRMGLVALLGKTRERPVLVRAIVRVTAAKQIASAITMLPGPVVARIVEILDEGDPPPRDRELAIGHALIDHGDARVRAWALKVTAVTEPSLLLRVVAPTPRARKELDAALRHAIATCSHKDLPAVLAPAFEAPCTGLTGALAARASAPSIPACAALLGCADPISDVARELDRFAAAGDKFEADLDSAAGKWLRTGDLPPLANARLYRWEAHTFALSAWITEIGGVLGALHTADALPGSLARTTLWRGISECVMFWRYRDVPRFKHEGSADLAVYAAERIDKDVGVHAARLVVALVEGGVVSTGIVRDRVLERVADADAPTREYVARLVRLDGMPEARRLEAPSPALLAEIRAEKDLDALARWCADPRPLVVQEAALALAAVGRAGQDKLASLLHDLASLPAPIPLLSSILLWDSPDAIQVAKRVALQPDLPPAWQFYLSLNLVAHGDKHAVERALAAVRAPLAGDWFFRREDWDALVAASNPFTCALALADSPHHHAYQRAVSLLLAMTRHSPEAGDALRRFLEVDGERPLHWRIDAARWLATEAGDATGLPLLVAAVSDGKASDWKDWLGALRWEHKLRLVELVTDTALIAGENACTEKQLAAVLEAARESGTAPEKLADTYVRVLEGAQTAALRRDAAGRSIGEALAYGRLHRVAEVFAWGVKKGVELTGRLLRIHMTSKETDFGHTRLDSSKIYVSPLPMLRDEPNGQDVVEGLVLHEIGHHVYHRGELEQALWKKAHQEGIGHLLNLLADEHLERNLRAFSPEYGDRLKRLGAYAFQHAPQEIKLATLLDALRAGAARALSASQLDVAFDELSLRLRRGAVLGELDRAGHPLARFCRALRMGLGNRHHDPRIAQALAMCKDIRALDMQGLYDLTRAIAELFGGAVALAKCFGGPEGLEFGERDDDVFGAGVDDDVLQQEVERILDPRGGEKKGKAGPRDRLAINVNDATAFDRIHKVERVHGDAEEHKAHAMAVARHAARLRTFLDELGLRWLPARARTTGRALDKTRLRALVTRGDPRILIARTPVRRTDLFLGVLVDCSGSMAAGDNIERARRFAILVAEAVRPLPGVHARFFGFTDSVIYDAGDKHDCDVVALEADGGNNDAAALYYAGNVAMAAPQRAKVLVMISDGLPTECSVASLRNLVTELSHRRGIVCAQVALRKLEEVCFPHYVVLDDHEPDVAVARFGRMIGDLCGRVL